MNKSTAIYNKKNRVFLYSQGVSERHGHKNCFTNPPMKKKPHHHHVIKLKASKLCFLLVGFSHSLPSISLCHFLYIQVSVLAKSQRTCKERKVNSKKGEALTQKGWVVFGCEPFKERTEEEGCA